MHPRAMRPDSGKIIADAAPLLHCQGRFLQALKDPGHVVRNRSHNETVEEGNLTACASASKDTTGGKVTEIGQSRIELLCPGILILFDLGKRVRDTLPALLNGAVNRLAVRSLQTVLHIPNLLGNRGN